MKNVNDITDELELIGFTTQEAKVICALFEGYIMTPTEVAKQTGISRAYAYDVLKSFAQKGICNEIQTSSIVKYELIEPNIVKDKIEKEIYDTYRTRTDTLNSAFRKLIPRYKTKVAKQEESDVELIKGFNKHRFEKFVELMNGAKKEMLLINKLGGYIQTDIDKNTKELIKKGCKLKSIYEVSGNFKIRVENQWIEASDGDLLEVFSRFESIGEQVRLSREVHQNMIIIDRKIVFVSLADPKLPKNSRSDVIIKDEYYANSMAQYFEYFWNQSKTISEFKTEISKKKK